MLPQAFYNLLMLPITSNFNMCTALASNTPSFMNYSSCLYHGQLARHALCHLLTRLRWYVQSDYGGMQQYVEWTNTSNASTVQQFYQDSSIQVGYTLLLSTVPAALLTSLAAMQAYRPCHAVRAFLPC